MNGINWPIIDNKWLIMVLGLLARPRVIVQAWLSHERADHEPEPLIIDELIDQ